MQATSEIDRDLSCIDCGYNLRGLPRRNRCPECGTPAIISITRAERTIPAGDHHYIPVAAAVGGTIDGVLFVQDCIRYALAAAARRAGRRTHVSAREFCDGVREYARAYFNDDAEAIGLLDEWHVRSSEDVGRIVYELVRRGLLHARDGDSEADFAGLFTLETLFKSPPQADDSCP